VFCRCNTLKEEEGGVKVGAAKFKPLLPITSLSLMVRSSPVGCNPYAIPHPCTVWVVVVGEGEISISLDY
jgi:hypothetical protein